MSIGDLIDGYLTTLILAALVVLAMGGWIGDTAPRGSRVKKGCGR